MYHISFGLHSDKSVLCLVWNLRRKPKQTKKKHYNIKLRQKVKQVTFDGNTWLEEVQCHDEIDVFSQNYRIYLTFAMRIHLNNKNINKYKFNSIT